jgi:hypothetical protein
MKKAGLSTLTFEVGECHIQRIGAEADSDGPYRHSNLGLTCELPTIHELVTTAAFGGINLTAQVILWLGGWTRSHKKMKTVSLRGSKDRLATTTK